MVEHTFGLPSLSKDWLCRNGVEPGLRWSKTGLTGRVPALLAAADHTENGCYPERVEKFSAMHDL